ncbi:hypothetical protein [Caulobacter sp. 17J80-11]|uniref:hypothetical protein n=1 Tax=Caulobacter sp. 17J80-11 TaxID=2763502 RepID=UPI001653B939|nr:hypothetical protein [Caulobacter sp. 17J80-11]MBC6981931.1 hypothetical protein [Caulobacter sp. 17J80-11]
MHTPRWGRATRAMAAVSVVLTVSACATTPLPKGLPGGAHETDLTEMAGAATQPLQDFNIQKVEVPKVLLDARADTYRAPPLDCEGLTKEIEALDAALGADLDVEPAKGDENPTMEIVEGAVRGLSTGWIPFRGAIRQVTGASAHAAKVEQAVVAGAVRRGYLKGVGEKAGCKPPAAPTRAVPIAPSH